MTNEEKQKAIDALKISAPVRVMTQEEFNDYIQTLNKIMDWLEQEPTTKNDLAVDCISREQALNEFCIYNSYDSIGVDKVRSYLKALPSVTPQEPIHGKCNQCKYYEGVHNVQGHAPCSYHKIGGVL